MTKIVISTCVLAAAVSFSAAGGELNEHLSGFKPMLAERWVGHYSPDSEGMTHIVSWQPMLGGQAVRFAKNVPEIGFSMETWFFWNPTNERVELFSLTSKGHVTQGTVAFPSGTVEIHLWETGPIETPQTRLIFRVDQDGKLYDEFFRRTNDGWHRGHLVIYTLGDGDS